MRFPIRISSPPFIVLVLALAATGGWAQQAAAQEQKGRAATKVEYDGWRRYMTNCARCHGDDAIYAYLRARAGGELPAGRPKQQ